MRALLKYLDEKEETVVAQLKANYKSHLYPHFKPMGPRGGVLADALDGMNKDE